MIWSCSTYRHTHIHIYIHSHARASTCISCVTLSNTHEAWNRDDHPTLVLGCIFWNSSGQWMSFSVRGDVLVMQCWLTDGQGDSFFKNIFPGCSENWSQFWYFTSLNRISENCTLLMRIFGEIREQPRKIRTYDLLFKKIPGFGKQFRAIRNFSGPARSRPV